MESLIDDFVKSLAFCYIKPENNKSGIYKKNKYYIEALGLIGNIYGRSFFDIEEHSDYYWGAKYVKYIMNKEGGYVSLAQIKCLARPNSKKRHKIKIPYKAFEILQCVTSLIDSNNIMHDICQEKKEKYCQQNGKKVCRDFMIGNLYKSLIEQRHIINSNRYAGSFLSELDDFKKNC